MSFVDGFMPPDQKSMDRYLDDITRGKIKNIDKLYFNDVDDALNAIASRPNSLERKALFEALQKRFKSYGAAKGWLAKTTNDPEAAAPSFVGLIIQDILGIESNPKDQVLREFTDRIEEDVKNALTKKGKKIFGFSKFLYDLVNAKNGDEFLKVLADGSMEATTKWLSSPNNYQWLIAKLKFVGVPAAVRLFVVKRVALLIKFAGKVGAGIAKFNLAITMIQIFFNSEDTADDKTQKRLAFLFNYEKVLREEERYDGINVFSGPAGTTVLSSSLPVLEKRLQLLSPSAGTQSGPSIGPRR